MKLLITAAAAVLFSGAALAESHIAPVGDMVEAALAAGDVEAGEKVFRKCRACHQVGEGAESKVGPALNNIVGASLAGFEDFRYSDGIVEMGEAGTVWTIENLDLFFVKPRDFIDGTRMTFAGLRKEEDRANVIAYLASLTAVD